MECRLVGSQKVEICFNEESEVFAAPVEPLPLFEARFRVIRSGYVSALPKIGLSAG
jgi:hypothetical protein